MRRESVHADMTTLGARQTPGEPRLRKACVIRADLGPALEFATTQGTVRAMFPIVGGEAVGSGWSGRILPGGADFALALPDGSYAIEARYCLELDDGTPVMITNAGRMVLQPDGSYFGRTRAELEVPEGLHRHLGAAVYFGTALAQAGDADHVYIELWEAVL
ncbi:DUF3237 family protein [Rhizobium sp. C1]|uniref:DUF3237 family protein n=1 Tax=Rhizobium sp. C1 TaxID=1349799 RepID=UPI001E55095F|nr:DUF3237 family protein [Rhizobium sp. C1]MCD2179510.1 DUF3237 family protein [Rhizobium sp. C1]